MEDPIEPTRQPADPACKAPSPRTPVPAHRSQEPGLDLDLELERIETEGVLKEGFTGQES